MKPRVMVFGTFDLLHPGHLFVIEQALERGEVTVIVARSENVARIKGRPPVESDDVRAAAVRAAFPAASVVLGHPTDFLSPIRLVKPDLILLGYDQRLPPGIVEKDLKGAKIERLKAHEPHLFKSSLKRPRD